MKLQVLSFEVEKIIGTKGENKGVEFSIPKAQCIVHRDGASPKVGVWNVPKGHPEVKPGVYTPTFKLEVGFDGKVIGMIDTLVPVKA